MGKKSRRTGRKQEAPREVELDDASDGKAECIDKIVAEARLQCPEAEDHYPITRDLFDRELWSEIETNWLEPGSTLSKEKAWQLVKDVRLESLKTKSIDIAKVYSTHENVEAAEEVELLFTTPYQFLQKRMQCSTPQRHHHYWCIRWFDLVPGIRQTISGCMICGPFFVDPPQDSVEDEHKFRSGWDLRDGNREMAECIRLGAGLSAKDISLKDVTRCLIPTFGILGKYHPGNRNHILQRTMLRLERQIRTWNDGDTSDPNTWEMSDAMHRRGGMLTGPKCTEALEREKRWRSGTQASQTWWPEVHVPEGVVECCLYRDGDGHQHKLSRMIDGTEVEVPTGSKKGTPSSRDVASALTIKTVFHKLDPADVQEALRNMSVS
ncbi:hypothetical protein ACHAXT_003104 [Thalassiosira profunda]